MHTPKCNMRFSLVWASSQVTSQMRIYRFSLSLLSPSLPSESIASQTVDLLFSSTKPYLSCQPCLISLNTAGPSSCGRLNHQILALQKALSHLPWFHSPLSFLSPQRVIFHCLQSSEILVMHYPWRPGNHSFQARTLMLIPYHTKLLCIELPRGLVWIKISLISTLKCPLLLTAWDSC